MYFHELLKKKQQQQKQTKKQNKKQIEEIPGGNNIFTSVVFSYASYTPFYFVVLLNKLSLSNVEAK